jgi:hypothetical protein
MNKLTLIGDIHGAVESRYLPILNTLGGPSIQVGDIGVGFPHVHLPKLPEIHKFIRGNHDNPEISKKHPNYLGDFGYIAEWDLFYVSGASTPLWAMDNFTPGFDWWPEEQLNLQEFNAAYDLYVEKKPRIMITHDTADIASIRILTKQGKQKTDNSSTGGALQAMFDAHKPSFWFFGHYHFPCEFKIHNTYFRCLGIHEDVEIDI